MKGKARIEAERQKQKDVHGWTAEHDAEHVNGELATVAFKYEHLAYKQMHLALRGEPGGCDNIPTGWPKTWHEGWWRPSKDVARNLVKAGALFQAELDRREGEGVVSLTHITNEMIAHRIAGIAAALDALAAGQTGEAMECLVAGAPETRTPEPFHSGGKRYLGVMVMVAVPRASGCVPGYDVRYPNGCIDWSPAAVFDTHCFELGETDDVTEALAERFHTNIGAVLDLDDPSTSMLATLIDWGRNGHAQLTAPVTNGLRCSLHCPFLTEDSDCAKHRDPKGHYCECEVDEAAETGEVGPLRCPLCLELHPVETPADVPADLLIHNPEGR